MFDGRVVEKRGGMLWSPTAISGRICSVQGGPGEAQISLFVYPSGQAQWSTSPF